MRRHRNRATRLRSPRRFQYASNRTTKPSKCGHPLADTSSPALGVTAAATRPMVLTAWSCTKRSARGGGCSTPCRARRCLCADHARSWAMRDSIGAFAAKHNRFIGAPGYISRMTWIKTNFLWMMYRCVALSRLGVGPQSSSSQRPPANERVRHTGRIGALSQAKRSSFASPSNATGSLVCWRRPAPRAPRTARRGRGKSTREGGLRTWCGCSGIQVRGRGTNPRATLVRCAQSLAQL